MVRLLKCQQDSIEPNEDNTSYKPANEELRAFGVALLCSLLDIFESDLTGQESKEIDDFIGDYNK